MSFLRDGYGQVEPTQLSAQKTGQIYASLPLDENVKVLQNGEFMFYDYANGSVNSGKDGSAAGEVKTMGEPMLVFNEIKLYEPFWRTSYKDFAMIRKGDNYVTSQLATAEYGDGSTTQGVAANPAHPDYPYRMNGIAPRLFKTNVGDLLVTNMVEETGKTITYAVGDKLVPTENTTTHTLRLKRDNAATTGMIWVVVNAAIGMPDGQDGLKLQRVQ